MTNKNTNNINDKNTMTGKRILGKDHWISNDDIHSGFNNNDLIVGGSGSGKTGGYVIPNIRQGLENMIVADTKSQLGRLLKTELKKQGYEIAVLDFVNPEKSMAYNPLEYVRSTKKKNGQVEYNQKDIVSLSHALITEVRKEDAFWMERARAVVAFLVAFTLEALREEDHNMHSVLEVLRVLLNNKEKIEMWVEEHPKSFAAKKFSMFRQLIPVERTWECVIQFVMMGLEPFDFTEMEYIFGRRGRRVFHIQDLCQKKMIVFLNISDTDRYADRLVNLFYTQAMQCLCLEADRLPEGRLPRPVRFILDDFASNAYIENFDKLISVIRSRNISASIILQSLTQLSAMYSEAQAGTIITNCDHMLYLGGQDVETAKYIGSRCNKTEETILVMPQGKAYLIERGKIGEMIDRVPPYEDYRKEDPVIEPEEKVSAKEAAKEKTQYAA